MFYRPQVHYYDRSPIKSKLLRLLATVSKVSWLDKNESYPRYTLEQGTTHLNKYVVAEFSFAPTHLEDIRIQDINKITDKEPNKSFDEEGHPMVSYLINSNLKVFAYEGSHIVNINRIAVQYIGPALPPLTQSDMDEAIQFRRDAAFEHSHHGRHAKAISLLHAHLRTNPNDVEAHLKLAESYKANSYINESIAEYKTTLTLCGNNSEIHARCIEGLHALKVDLPNNSLPVTNLPITNSSPSQRRININPADNHSTNKSKSLDVGF